MFKKSFFNMCLPKFEYTAVDAIQGDTVSLPTPEQVTLLFSSRLNGKAEAAVAPGDRVKTGQRLKLTEDGGEYAVASVTGTVASVAPYTGDFGFSGTAVTIDAEPADEFDDALAAALAEEGEDGVKGFLKQLPGDFPADRLFNPARQIETIVITGVETDLLLATRQYALKSNIEAMNRGISALKKIAGVHKVVIALPQELVKSAGAVGGASGVELRVIDSQYPSGEPRMIMKDTMGQVVPADGTCEDVGVCFISAEAVASLGKALLTGQVPVTKTLTLIRKDQTSVLVEVRLGTPVREILKAFDEKVFEKDRLIVGGPMTGSAVYTEDHPVGPDTDALMVQDNAAVALVSDYPCVNCGECVRICPAQVPVNMLVRFLEARKYEEAADEYDLYSCVDCGLCSAVCVSRIPIFQYIRLAKYELDRIRLMEEEDV